MFIFSWAFSFSKGNSTQTSVQGIGTSNLKIFGYMTIQIVMRLPWIWIDTCQSICIILEPIKSSLTVCKCCSAHANQNSNYMLRISQLIEIQSIELNTLNSPRFCWVTLQLWLFFTLFLPHIFRQTLNHTAPKLWQKWQNLGKIGAYKKKNLH